MNPSEPVSSSTRDPVERLAEEFLDRYRRGERPTVSDYVQRYPDLADDIRDLFPALVEIEGLKSDHDDATGQYVPRAIPTLADSFRLGDFLVIREVGRGGMGVVYEAVQESLGRRVALKVLPPALLARPNALERFRREARSAAALHHTNIVPVFGIGEADGHHYYAMQFIRGQTLDAILGEIRARHHQAGRPIAASTETAKSTVEAGELARALLTGRFAPPDGPDSTAIVEVSSTPSVGHKEEHPGTTSPESLSLASETRYVREIARVGQQVAEALAYAHQQGVLHRDIKPSNLLMDLSGTTWVADFGLAKIVDGENLTTSRDIVGTLRYMAPERFEGHSDGRSDVYGLGVTLYELLTLRPAFQASDQAGLIREVLHGAPRPPRALDARIPRDLETIVLKAMARDPADRYSTADSMAEDLRRFLSDRTILARRSTLAERSWRWCRRNHVVASLLGLVAFLLVGGTIASTLAAVKYNHLATSEGFLRTKAQDAAVVATERSRALEWQLYVNLVGRAYSEWEAGLPGNSERLLARCPPRHRGWEWDFVERLCHLDRWTDANHKQNVWGVAISPDGRKVASGSGRFVWATEPGLGRFALNDASTGRVLFSRDNLRGGVQGVAFSPDGRTVAFCTSFRGDLNRPMPEAELVVLDVETGRNVWSKIVPGIEMLCLSFSPDGTRLAVGCGAFNGEVPADRTVCLLWDAATGDQRATIPGLPGGVHSLAFSPDGTRLALGNSRVVQLIDTSDNSTVRLLGGDVSFVYAVTFSPDGKRLASGGNSGIARVWDVETGLVVRKFAARGIRSLSFSPDGKKLAMASEELATIVVCDIDTGETLAQLRGHVKPITSVMFSPDGMRLVSGGRDGTIKLWDAITGQPTILRHVPVGRAEFLWVTGTATTPDGRLVATSSRDNVVRLWDARTGRLKRKLVGPTPRDWRDGFWSIVITPDGKQVIAGHGQGRILRWDLESGKDLAPLKTSGEVVHALAISPDGRTLASTSWDRAVTIWDMATLKPTRRIPLILNGTTFTSLDFSPDGTRLVAGVGGFEWVSSSGGVASWDVATGRTIFSHPVAGEGVRDVAYSPDGRLAAAANSDGRIFVWKAQDGQPVHSFVGHAESANALVFSADGRRLISGGHDALKAWDLSTWDEVFSYREIKVLSLALGNHGNTLVAGGFQPIAILLDSTAQPAKQEIPSHP